MPNERTAILIVTELPEAGDNWHLYMLKGGTTQAPTYSFHIYDDGSWVQLKWAAKT